MVGRFLLTRMCLFITLIKCLQGQTSDWTSDWRTYRGRSYWLLLHLKRSYDIEQKKFMNKWVGAVANLHCNTFQCSWSAEHCLHSIFQNMYNSSYFNFFFWFFNWIVQWSNMKHSARQFSAPQSTVQWFEVQCRLHQAVQCNNMKFSAVQSVNSYMRYVSLYLCMCITLQCSAV